MALTFTEKTVIVSDFYEYYAEDYAGLISKYNLGFPLAFAFVYGGTDGLTEKGKEWIAETYEGLCAWLGVDHHGEYEDINSMLEIAFDNEDDSAKG